MSPPLLRDADLAALVPHAGNMCLWSLLRSADERHVRVETESHLDQNNPLRTARGLSSVHLLEYGAQAMAVHGGWLARSGGAGTAARPGVLAAVRDLQLQTPWLDGLIAPLICEAERLVANAGGWMYRFELRCGEQLVGSGRASVIHMPDSV